MESFFRKRHMGGKKKDNDTGRSLRHASTHPFEEIPPSSILNIFKNQFRVRLFTLAFTHRLKWNRGSISRAHVLNYVEHIRGELTPSSMIPRGSMSFHEMNDNSYCLSRPFTRLVKKKNITLRGARFSNTPFSTPFSTPYHHPQHRSPST